MRAGLSSLFFVSPLMGAAGLSSPLFVSTLMGEMILHKEKTAEAVFPVMSGSQ